jgi:type VI secretion system protein VasD
MRNVPQCRPATAWAIALVMLLSACSTGSSKVGGMLNLDTDLELTFQVDADLNPDDGGKPAPVFIRLYELKSTKLFDKAGFIELFERDQEVLGADFAGKVVLKPFRPGGNRVEKLVLGPETKFVGLYAEFLRYKNAKYKAVIPVVSHNIIASSARIQMSGNQLRVIGD